MPIRDSDSDNTIIRHNPIQQGALISIIIFLIVQGAGWIWWASGVSTTLNYMRDDIFSLKTSVGNYIQVKADIASLEKEFNDVRDHGSPAMDRRLTILEYKIKNIQGDKT